MNFYENLTILKSSLKYNQRSKYILMAPDLAQFGGTGKISYIILLIKETGKKNIYVSGSSTFTQDMGSIIGVLS